MTHVKRTRLAAVGTIMALGAATVASASIDIPWSESFTDDPADWFNGSGDAVADWASTDGIDGSDDGYLTADLDFTDLVDGATPILFRAQDEFNSSNNAFVGDWISEGAGQISFWVRHDADAPIPFFMRFATPDNFPGANAVQFVPVAPGAWTQVTFDIVPGNPQLIFEGPASTFESVFSNIGHLQLGLTVPDTLAGAGTFTFDFDQVSVPTPGALVLLPIAALVARRRSRHHATK